MYHVPEVLFDLQLTPFFGTQAVRADVGGLGEGKGGFGVTLSVACAPEWS